MVLRDYQKDIIDQTINSNRSTLIQVPTGGGKTVIAKEIALALVNKHNLQVLFVAPKIILMEQTAKVFKSLNPHIVHGINEYDKDHHILISTIQTASRRDINPNVIFVDEIHYGFSGKMLQKLIKDKSDTRVIGLSATPYDKTGNQLEGFGLVLDKYDLKYMVENNYLVDIKSYVLTKIRNLDKVSVIGGDYNSKELSKIVSDNQTILEIVQSTAEYILKYKKTIVFAVDINHAELLTQAYQHEGFGVKVLHSKMSKDDIDRNIRLFRENQIKILVSVLMLTTGFDVPDTDVAVIARPTKSQNLYKQMVGRVLRIAENKNHAVLLDCANVIENLGMPLDPIKIVETNENGTNKQKCKDCGSENLSLRKDGNKSFWECKDCGHKKEIETGAYECKMCNKLYTHDAKFEIKNDKLYLVCDTCPYPTLISEYKGDEKLVEVSKYWSFDRARAYIRTMNFESKTAWRKYTESNSFPSYIPSNPQDIYQNNGWVSLKNWIGAEEYLLFKEARDFIRTLNLKSYKEWRTYSFSNERNFRIPGNPEEVYASKGWISFDDWLGIDISNIQKKENQYLTFEEAREFVRKLGLESDVEWVKYIQGKLDGYSVKPENIPNAPGKIYKKHGWKGMNDWLGANSSDIEEQANQYLPFKEAREFVIKLNLEAGQWKAYSNNQLDGFDPKPVNIPKIPKKIYKDKGWIDFDNWLGLDLKKQNELDQFKNKVVSLDLDELCSLAEEHTYEFYSDSNKLDILFQNLDKKSLLYISNNVTNVNLLMMLMNKAVEENNFDLFKNIAEQKYELSELIYEMRLRNDSNAEKYQSYSFSLNKDSVMKLLSRLKIEDSFAVVKYIIHKILFYNPEILVFAVKNKLSEVANEIVSIGIDLSEIIEDSSISSDKELDDSIDDLSSVLAYYPDNWTSFDFSSTLSNIWGDFWDEEWEDVWFSKVTEVKHLIELLVKYQIQIQFLNSEINNSFVKFLLDHKLEKNYTVSEKHMIIVKNFDGFMTDISLHILAMNSECSWSDLELAVLHNFNVDVVKFIEEKINKDKVTEESILIRHYLKEISNNKVLSEINENPLIFVLLKLVAAAYRNKNIDVVQFLKTFLPGVSDEHIKHLAINS